jgi:2'-5' RNA ligase
MKDVQRLFIAIELNQEIRQNLAKVAYPFHENGIKWVDAENIHLTLKFLGDIPTRDIRSITDALTSSISNTPPFEISVKGTGCFPNPRQARVLWAGLVYPENLSNLQHNIDESLLRLGIPAEKRPFSPHLTLARVVEGINESIASKAYQHLLRYQNNTFGKIVVEHVTLFNSTLTREGSIYRAMVRVPLQKNLRAILLSNKTEVSSESS